MDKLAVRWADWFYKPVRNLGFALSLAQASFRRIWRRGRCLQSPTVQIPLIAPRCRLLWRLTHNVSVRLRLGYLTRLIFPRPFSQVYPHPRKCNKPPSLSYGRPSLSNCAFTLPFTYRYISRSFFFSVSVSLVLFPVHL